MKAKYLVLPILIVHKALNTEQKSSNQTIIVDPSKKKNYS